jgi:hypothetical protein
MPERTPNPQPTSNTNYSIYLWPRAKDPALQRIYDYLHEIGWRFDAGPMHWHTPEGDSLQGFGRLEHATDCSWARIQPPSVVRDGMPYRSEPLLELTQADYGRP